MTKTTQYGGKFPKFQRGGSIESSPPNQLDDFNLHSNSIMAVMDDTLKNFDHISGIFII